MNRHLIKLALIALLWGPGVVLAAPQELIFTHVVSPDTPKGKMATMFKKMIEDKLGDRYTVTIYPNSELLNDEESVDAIAEGRIHFAAPALSKFEAYTQQLKVFDLPFLFPDMDAVNRFQESPTGQALLTSMQDKGVLGLGYLHNGLKQLTASKPFTQPADLAGLKFRIINSDVLRKQFEVINVEPVPMAFPKVYPALAANEIQGQENTWSNIFSQKFYEYQPHMMESNHGVLDYMLITNTQFWNGLSEEDRRYFEFALNMALRYGNAVALAKSNNDKTELARMKGINVVRLNPQQLELWQRAMEPLWAEYEPLIGADIINAARQAGTLN